MEILPFQLDGDRTLFVDSPISDVSDRPFILLQ